ncbi:MAG: Lipopolysaccharide export system permease protein LptF [Legionellaceae bacterium]
MILRRYLIKEISLALFSITTVLLIIFMSNQLVRYLSYAADGRLEILSILKLMIVEIPHLLGLLLPLGLYLAILLIFGRLYVDQEMVVINSCGISRRQILQMLLPLIFILTGIVAVLTLVINPKILNYRNQLLEQKGNMTILKTLLPGRFQELPRGRYIIYAGAISQNHELLKDLFVAELNQDKEIKHWNILAAGKGYQQIDKKTKETFIITTDSYRYTGIPGKRDFQIVHYGKYGVKIQNKVTMDSVEEDALPTLLLFRTFKKNPEYLAELEWRFSLPMMVLTLSLLAIPLSRINRGDGRYIRFLPAILLYIIYANMLIVSRSWVSRKIIPGYIGLWWIHGIILILIGLYYRRNTTWRFFKTRYLKLGKP